MQTFNLAKTLLKLNFETEILCYFENETSIVRTFHDNGVPTRLLNLDRGISILKFLNILIKEIKLTKPDIIHVQYMAPGALPIIAAKIAGVKIIYATVHQPCTKEHGRLAKVILNFASLFTTKFFAVSQNAEKSWFGNSSLFNEKNLKTDQSKHFTIYNAIDIDKINEISNSTNKEQIRSDYSLPDKFIIGSVSRLRFEKGIDILIEAFNLMIKNNIDAFLVIVGSGPEEESLQLLVNKYCLSEKVKFIGTQDWNRAMQILSIMNIVVIPSRFEGFGLTAVEAMAFGKPVIASNSYGLKEIVEHNETGLLFQVADSMELNNAIMHLINNQSLQYKFGEAAKSSCIKFSLHGFEEKIYSLYNY